VNDRAFIDYYEVLQLSPNANSETVERVYRLLAKRYHPDNQATGDADKFTEIREAYEVLTNPDKRASYDLNYDDNRSRVWQIFDDASAGEGPENDRRMFHGILSLLYAARRRDVRNPGIGTMFLGRMLGCPGEHLDFPIWYLKQRKWVEILENGQLAITVDGVDKLADREFELRADRLLTESELGQNATDTNPTADVANQDGASPVSETGSKAEEDGDLPEGKDFLEEAFADDLPPRARA